MGLGLRIVTLVRYRLRKMETRYHFKTLEAVYYNVSQAHGSPMQFHFSTRISECFLIVWVYLLCLTVLSNV